MKDKTLNEMSIAMLDDRDVYGIDGGSLIDYAITGLKKLTPAAFAVWTIENWEDVKKGFSDGWNVR